MNDGTQGVSTGAGATIVGKLNIIANNGPGLAAVGGTVTTVEPSDDSYSVLTAQIPSPLAAKPTQIAAVSVSKPSPVAQPVPIAAPPAKAPQVAVQATVQAPAPVRNPPPSIAPVAPKPAPVVAPKPAPIAVKPPTVAVPAQSPQPVNLKTRITNEINKNLEQKLALRKATTFVAIPKRSSGQGVSSLGDVNLSGDIVITGNNGPGVVASSDSFVNLGGRRHF